MKGTLRADGIVSDVAAGSIGGYVGTRVMEPPWQTGLKRFCWSERPA